MIILQSGANYIIYLLHRETEAKEDQLPRKDPIRIENNISIV